MLYCSGTTIGQNILFDIIYLYRFWRALGYDPVEINCPRVVGTFHLASSIGSVLLDEIYTSLLRVWVEVMKANEEVYTWIWSGFTHLGSTDLVRVGEMTSYMNTRLLHHPPFPRRIPTYF